jgi:hypothetical protein
MLSGFIFSCSTTTCANDRKFNAAKNPDEAQKMTLDKGSLNTKKIKVAKSDGTLQCSQGKQIPLVEMQKQLKDITVFSSTNQNDGMIRTQVCGTPTGAHNVYEILESDLAKAQALGFSLWKR